MDEAAVRARAKMISDQWSKAGIYLGIPNHQGLKEEWDPYYVSYHATTLSLEQAAVSEAFIRLHESHAYTVESKGAEGFYPSGVRFLDGRAFLTSAHSYWKVFMQLQKTWSNYSWQMRGLASEGQSKLDRIYNDHRDTIDDARVGRDHVAHLWDRIATGRDEDFFPHEKMDQETFRQNIGRFDGTNIHFGDERFNVKRIHQAVIDAGERFASYFKAEMQRWLNVVLIENISGSQQKDETDGPSNS